MDGWVLSCNHLSACGEQDIVICDAGIQIARSVADVMNIAVICGDATEKHITNTNNLSTGNIYYSYRNYKL